MNDMSASNSGDPLSPPGSPLKAHESIWKRSKKILGMSRYSFLQQIDAQDKTNKNSKSDDNEVDSGKPPVSKRREQVRRAQKTHRQRTENYIKALEQEVLRLQKEQEANALERQKKQRTEKYMKALERQVIELQKEKALSLRETESQFGAATLTLSDQNGNWALKAEMPQYPSYMMDFGNPSPAFGFETTGFDQAFTPNATAWEMQMLINPIANHQNAIDFVLSLEQGCMTHIHDHMLDPKSVSGHSLTASACLIEQAPPLLGPQASWTTSHAEIERLFQLASSLGLDGEITPVEAWNKIWEHPRASKLGVLGLQHIEDELKKLVCCYEFGGVMLLDQFQAILDNGLAQS